MRVDCEIGAGLESRDKADNSERMAPLVETRCLDTEARKHSACKLSTFVS